MFEQRNLKLDLLALALLATVIFLAAALFSYDPADPPNQLVFPQHAHAANMCGHWGAVCSRLLLEGLGLGAYYLLVSLAGVRCGCCSRGAKWASPGCGLGGWLLSLAGVTTLAALAVPGFSPGPVIGAGGYLGATGKGVLQTQFASVGTYILTVSMILGGLLLSTDYALLRLLAWAVASPPAAWAAACCRSARPMPRSSTGRDPTSMTSS